MQEQNSIYLWDMADTLFMETWDAKRTGLKNFDSYIESLGYNLQTIDAKTYEWQYEQPFKDGRMSLTLMPGFVETLQWTKHNAVFTTGNKEQIDWRANVLLAAGTPDIRAFFEKIYSTFDYGNTNKKTSEMFRDILLKEAAQGNTTLIYSDNLLENCKKFQEAAGEVGAMHTRLYHIAADSLELKPLSSNFFEVPNLLTMLKNEQLQF